MKVGDYVKFSYPDGSDNFVDYGIVVSDCRNGVTVHEMFWCDEERKDKSHPMFKIKWGNTFEGTYTWEKEGNAIKVISYEEYVLGLFTE